MHICFCSSEFLHLFYLWKGTVTEFKDPSDFYVQLYSAEVLEYMNQLSASLKETYANTVPEEDYIPVKGEVCVAKYTVDQVTSLEMNYLIRCFNLLWLYQLDTRAFNDALGGLKARLVRLLFFFLRQSSRLFGCLLPARGLSSSV